MKHKLLFVWIGLVSLSMLCAFAQEPAPPPAEQPTQAPAEQPAPVPPIKALTFGVPTPTAPFHHMIMTLNAESLPKGLVTQVEVDGKPLFEKWVNDVQFLNVGKDQPIAAGVGIGTDKTEGQIAGGHDFQVLAPCNWVNGSSHTMRVAIKSESGEERVFEGQASAPEKGGYWNPAWQRFMSFVLKETAGIPREQDPVTVTLGVFADDLANPDKEIRVVTYAPDNPKAQPDGYVVVPAQVISVTEWRDEKIMAVEEHDPETNERVHRYDPTKTVELVFLADLQPHETRVYQVLYGNPAAEPAPLETDLAVTKGEGLARIVKNKFYEFGLSTNSGMVETVKVLGNGEPVLLEHRIETNGAVHWNPGCYSPPTPWVHASDWENPEFEEITGPIVHLDRRYAPLPHMTQAVANVSYSFYAGKPYVLMSTLLDVQEDLFVKALRNMEIVFNHAVLDEFVWQDHEGQIHALPIETAKKHPIHALEIAPDTPWMAFISRKHKVGFANILLAYQNMNRFGAPVSELQPYIYVQNGPWIYWSRGLVYPFGGKNISRMVRVRKGSMYYEKNAWVPFRFAEGDNPFAGIQNLQKQLTNPPEIVEWAPMDDRTPAKWVMPILTMPFNEGVAGAVSGHKEVKNQ